MKDKAYKYFESFDGARICYDVEIVDPDEYVFVMLHGLGGDLTSWKEERAKLKELGLSTIAMDLRGHGSSARSDAENFYDFQNYTKDVIEIIKVEGIKKPILVGHCFGGMISMLTEYYFPSTASAMILIDTSYKPPYFAEAFVNHDLARKMLHLISEYAPNYKVDGRVDHNQFKYTSDLDYKRIMSDMLHTSVKTYLLILEQLVKYDAKKILPRMSLPTLIIEGKNDTIFPPQIAEYLKDSIANSEIAYIPDANHIVVITNPAEIVMEMVKFMKNSLP